MTVADYLIFAGSALLVAVTIYAVYRRGFIAGYDEAMQVAAESVVVCVTSEPATRLDVVSRN